MINCDEKLLEPTIFFILYTKSPYNSGSESPWRKRDFKSNLKFRFQIIVSLIKLRKSFAKFMIQIALFNKFLSLFNILPVLKSAMWLAALANRILASITIEKHTR